MKCQIYTASRVVVDSVASQRPARNTFPCDRSLLQAAYDSGRTRE